MTPTRLRTALHIDIEKSYYDTLLWTRKAKQGRFYIATCAIEDTFMVKIYGNVQQRQQFWTCPI
jgi:hypothetical protein